MINGCWLSCHSPCPRTGRTFAADAIISNPPAFAHVHCAEALGIPLLMSFSESFWLFSVRCFLRGGDRVSDAMVCDHNKSISCTALTEVYCRCPTTSFSHPLVNITTSNAGYRLSNYLSYAAADLLTWQG
jgi:sterol 3beta-glucosyltransferase